ncbi:Telomeric repeat-binding factor 2-interacting protein 1 [Amphibalanus amphitrite]|uniref:Telomeric repeat-binding factor 2-interacting protein 1 n=1 Tax=Amphibalanus amphitrite TaxID=1232801 RepID=A0A6A4WBN8_AMPAM|nr:Telomeric repeat-binding factor 2-interacting protein 1 [Amphibalanus amphitrite]
MVPPSQLFVRTGDGKPMEFYLEVGLPRPERCRLQALVVGHGGALVTNPARRRHAVTLGAGVPGSQQRPDVCDRQDTFSIKFVDECVRKGRVVDLCPFRLQSTSRYSRSEWVNDVLLGWSAWSDLAVWKAPPDSDTDEELALQGCCPQGGRQAGWASPVRRTEALVRFVAEYGYMKYPSVMTLKFWFWMAFRLPAVLSGHFTAVDPRLADFKSTVPLHMVESAASTTGAKLPLTEDEQRALEKYCEEETNRYQPVRQPGNSDTESEDLIGAKASGNKLFVRTGDGKPMEFYLEAGLPRPERCRLQALVVGHGGTLVTNPARRRHVVTLGAGVPGSQLRKATSVRRDTFSIKFVDECVRKGRVVDLCPFRLQSTSRYNRPEWVNDVLLGWCAWSDLGVETAVPYSYFVGQLHMVLLSLRGGRLGFTREKDEALVRFVAEYGIRHIFPPVTGKLFWFWMASQLPAVLSGHSPPSLFDRFFEQVGPRLADFKSTVPLHLLKMASLFTGTRLPLTEDEQRALAKRKQEVKYRCQQVLWRRRRQLPFFAGDSCTEAGDLICATDSGNKAYSRAEEDVLVRRVLAEHAAGGLLGGRRVWQKIEDSGVLPGRSWQSWQSLKERFHKRIAPALHHEYNEVDSVFRVFLAAELGL